MKTHYQQFIKFHADNPHIYTRLKSMTLALKSRGYKRWGMRNLWEKLRYDLAIDTNSETGTYRLNNNYPPFYARLLMKDISELKGFFEIRGRRELVEIG